MKVELEYPYIVLEKPALMEKVVRKIGMREQQSDFAYWQTKSMQELLAAIEIIRDQYIKFITKDAEPRLQRVCSVVKQVQGTQKIVY